MQTMIRLTTIHPGLQKLTKGSSKLYAYHGSAKLDQRLVVLSMGLLGIQHESRWERTLLGQQRQKSGHSVSVNSIQPLDVFYTHAKPRASTPTKKPPLDRTNLTPAIR